MTKYKVIVSSTVYYEAEIEANSSTDIDNLFDNGELNFTKWNDIDLESRIESIQEIK